MSLSITHLARTINRYERAVRDPIYRKQLAKRQKTDIQMTDTQLIHHYKAHAECLRRFIAYKKAKQP